MSAESGSAIRASTPLTTGRDSPILHVNRQNHEEGVNVKDKSYRRYANGVERALTSFESPQQEWADYISFLGRLLKALQTHPPDTYIIPDSHLVATRLAQCLTPALPPGVHRKAIDVYNYIFETIGSSKLKHQLHLWLPGLVPVLTFASLAIRPEFQGLLDKHILSLDADALRAPLKSIILCILPGLEDESSEDHEAWLSLLNKARKASIAGPTDNSKDESSSHETFFWQTLFLAVMTNPSRRLGALSFFIRELPSYVVMKTVVSSPQEESLHLSPTAAASIVQEPGLLIRCMCSGLLDQQILVQRGFLDLLVTRLPLNSDAIQKMVPQTDLDRLILAATGVVGRKDMSLNRRLWTWFLGPDAKDDVEATASRGIQSPMVEESQRAAYFAQFGLDGLNRCMQEQFASTSSSAVDRSRPFRLCLSLMDRWEVGGLLIPSVMVPALRSAMNFSANAENSGSNEVIKSASNFFDGVESSLIWATFNSLIGAAYNSKSTSQQDRLAHITLCTFIVSNFNIREEEMITQFIPRSSLYLLARMMDFYHDSQRFSDYAEMLAESSSILEKLLSLVPTRAFSVPQKASDLAKRRTQSSKLSSQEIITKMEHYYRTQQHSVAPAAGPFSMHDLGALLVQQSSSFLFDTYSLIPHNSTVDIFTKVLCGLVLTVPQATTYLLLSDIHQSLITACNSIHIDEQNRLPFRVLSSLSTVLHTTQTSAMPLFDETAQQETVQNLLIEELWKYLDTQTAMHNVESVRCLWQLESIDPSLRLVEAVVSTQLTNSDSDPDSKIAASSTLMSARRFITFWAHSAQDRSTTEKISKSVSRKASNPYSANGHGIIPHDPLGILTRPLLIVLGSLNGREEEMAFFIRSWLHDLPELSRVFLILIEQLLDLHCITDKDMKNSSDSSSTSDGQECLYYFRLILEVVRVGSEQVWISLASEITRLPPNDAADSPNMSCQDLIVQLALRAFNLVVGESMKAVQLERDLHLTALALITELVNGRYPKSLIDQAPHESLLTRLHGHLESIEPLVQTAYLSTITASLRLAASKLPESPSTLKMPTRNLSKDSLTSSTRPGNYQQSNPPSEPNQAVVSKLLMNTLKLGFKSLNARAALDSWVQFLLDMLPLFPGLIFQNLIPLVECICRETIITFTGIKNSFENATNVATVVSDMALVGLLNGLEHLIANAHHRMLQAGGPVQGLKSVENAQGFFGNMVQGVFTTEPEKSSRSTIANSRLTVLLCFQDAVRACFQIWSWGSNVQEKLDATTQASQAYVAIRLRNRARRLLEHLFAAEALECMETLARIWDTSSGTELKNVTSVFGLLNVLSGSKPKHIIPAIFNAIYSRTAPASLEPSKISSLTSELNDIDLVAFLIEYTRTLDDDAMDEIWSDCMAFLRDVLANPLPHNQILPSLQLFIALLAEKVDNTNFGEHRRMRKELGDLFLRILTATFTTRPLGFLQDPSASMHEGGSNATKAKRQPDLIPALINVIPQLTTILGENDRIQNAVQSITASVIGPTVRAKAFPANIQVPFLLALQQLTKIPQAARSWKKDVADAFNDSRFFMMQHTLIQPYWLEILGDFVHNDKDRLPEIIARLPAPTTAGIVFGVGATSARLEADRRAQSNLRRITLLLLAAPRDTFAKSIGSLAEKLSQLSTATATSSPSSMIFGDVYMLIRAMFLRMSSTHLAPVWPLVSLQLQEALSSILKGGPDGPDRYSNSSMLQAVKLLDLLIALNQDEFQLYAWLFVSDSTDALHHQSNDHHPFSAFSDAISDGLSADNAASAIVDTGEAIFTPRSIFTDSSGRKVRRPALDEMLRSLAVDMADVRAMAKDDLIAKVLRPFFGQLSLLCYEATYDMVEADVDYCTQSLVRDLFQDVIH